MSAECNKELPPAVPSGNNDAYKRRSVVAKRRSVVAECGTSVAKGDGSNGKPGTADEQCGTTLAERSQKPHH